MKSGDVSVTVNSEDGQQIADAVEKAIQGLRSEDGHTYISGGLTININYVYSVHGDVELSGI